MNVFDLMQVSEKVLVKSAEMAESDPHGIIITIVSVSVVFSVFLVLYGAYALVEKLSSVHVRFRRNPDKVADRGHGQKKAVHDEESYVITIKRKQVSESVTEKRVTAPVERSVTNIRTEKSGRTIAAPLPGVIVSVNVKVGDRIREGQLVAVLDAMKMENDIQSEYEGIVDSVNVERGDSVLEGDIIITLK